MHFFSSRHLILGVLVFLTLGTNALIAYLNIQRLIGNGRNVALTFTVSDNLDQVLSLVNEMDAGERSFVLTGQERALTSYHRSLPILNATLDAIGKGADDLERKTTLRKLRAAVNQHDWLLQQSIALRRKKNFTQAQALANFSATKRSGANVERLVEQMRSQMRSRQQEMLEKRALDTSEAAEDATRTFWIATGTEIAFLTLILYLLWRAARQNFALESAYSDLKRAEEMRDNLSAMLVHDLRTPLTSLLGPLHMLGSGMLGPLDATQSELVTMSEQSGQRLLHLVNELLDISKMEAGEFQIHRAPVELGDLVQQALAGVQVFDGGNGAQLRTEVETPSQEVEVDADLLVRVLINLLGNALKFTPATGTITVGAAQQGEQMRFWVRDTGKGIPPQYVDKIFEKFGQVESRAQGQRFSTGLGLTFCKLAVEAHGGRIWLESEVGHGSTFWFSVPTPSEAIASLAESSDSATAISRS